MSEMIACTDRAEALLKSKKIDGPSFGELMELIELRKTEIGLGETR
jgi:hypothetical protein